MAARTHWKLARSRGPQGLSERGDLEKLNYLGKPKRFKYFSGRLFQQEVQAFRSGATIANLTEAEFMRCLQATSTRAANHSVVRNYLVAFSGPQCYSQRDDAALLGLEPTVSGVRAPYKTKEFAWLQCNVCSKWRRVDRPTAFLYDSRTWKSADVSLRRREFLEAFPGFPAFFRK